MAFRRSLRAEALDIWKSGVRAAHAGRLVEAAVRVKGDRLHLAGERVHLDAASRIVVVGAGKAGAAMAHALERRLGRRLLVSRNVEGWVNVPASQVRELLCIHLHAARGSSANRPTMQGVRGSLRMFQLLGGLAPDDLVICLLSGGGSALLPAPAGAVTLGDKQEVTDLLHASGATINEMNAVRKHLSSVKGGGLARATRARVVSLVISDVVGDPLDVIASGPTAADPTTYEDALEVLRRHRLTDRAPRRVVNHLRRGAAGRIPETLKRTGSRIRNHVIGNNRTALGEAAGRARALGYRVVDLSSSLEGESRELGVLLAGLARGARDDGAPARPPLCLLSGGETTVTLGDRPGRGGRNMELVLGALRHLGEGGLAGIAILSGGTDGEDGPTDAAGAVADARVARRARTAGLDPARFLERHDAYRFFDRAGGLVRTGPTHTNVMDLRVVLVRPRSG